MTTVRCPMRECRRAFDLDALAATGATGETPCMHLVAAWRDQAAMPRAVLRGLEGNRELVIRNVRPPEFADAALQARQPAIEAVVRQFGKVVEAVDDPQHVPPPGMGALFGDQHERDAISRELAQLLIGPDPMISRVAG